jgi:putative glycosyltransferase
LVTKNEQLKLSVVTTLYASNRFIADFYNRMTTTVNKITDSYELIFVNDGSPDNSLELITAIAEKDTTVKVVNLSKNFGHHNAMLAGLLQSKGEQVFLIDVDLEEEPELLYEFWNEYQQDESIDVIYGVAKSREGSVIRKNLGSAFYKLFNSLSQTKIPENLLTIRLMSRRYIDAVAQYQESSLFLGGLFADVGFKQIPKSILKDYKGSTSYTLRKRIGLLVNAITSFSSKPLEFFVYVGAFVCFLSFIAIVTVIIQKFALGVDVAGWASVIVALSFFGGLQILSIGVIGTYLGKVFNEVKRRPRYIVSEIIHKEEEHK